MKKQYLIPVIKVRTIETVNPLLAVSGDQESLVVVPDEPHTIGDAHAKASSVWDDEDAE
jgi:hypothetical protein